MDPADVLMVIQATSKAMTVPTTPWILMRNPLTSRGDHVIVQAAFGLHLDTNEFNANTRESLTYSNCISAQPSRLTTRKEQADLLGKRFQESCM